MTSRVLGPAVLMATMAVARLGAQTTSSAIPPIRPLGPIAKVAKDSLDYIESIRVLSDGRVLANDTRSKRVVLFDSSLTHFITVADTTSGTAKAYGASGGELFPFTGDSSLLRTSRRCPFWWWIPPGKLGG